MTFGVAKAALKGSMALNKNRMGERLRDGLSTRTASCMKPNEESWPGERFRAQEWERRQEGSAADIHQSNPK